MIEQFIQGRTSVFMDASNVYHSQKSIGFKKGKRVLVISSKEHVAWELIREAKYIDIKKLRNCLEFQPHKKYPPGDELRRDR